MPTPYTVQKGDNLSKIARRNGLRSWKTIYYHPDNEGFRRLRPNPNLIYPGDVVQIPDSPSPTGASPVPARRGGGAIGDDKCCTLATDTECYYTGNKANYTCPPGYVKSHWVCGSGSRRIACGECAKAPSPNCYVAADYDFNCSIWYYL